MSMPLMIDGFSSFSHSIAVDLFIASENTSQSILLVTLFLLSSKRVNKSRLVVIKIVISLSPFRSALQAYLPVEQVKIPYRIFVGGIAFNVSFIIFYHLTV